MRHVEDAYSKRTEIGQLSTKLFYLLPSVPCLKAAI